MARGQKWFQLSRTKGVNQVEAIANIDHLFAAHDHEGREATSRPFLFGNYIANYPKVVRQGQVCWPMGSVSV